MTGSSLTSHPDVSKVSFTGSVDIGSKVMSSCAAGIKHVTLELGGKSPIIVFDDSDIDDAVTGAMLGKQYCSIMWPNFFHNATTIEAMNSLSPWGSSFIKGVVVNQTIRLNYISHIDSQWFFTRQLKSFEPNSGGLKTVYISNIRCTLLYGTLAPFSLLLLASKEKLESLQRSVTKTITPDMCHIDSLAFLSIPLLNDFIFLAVPIILNVLVVASHIHLSGTTV